jgi:hypothetical protein
MEPNPMKVNSILFSSIIMTACSVDYELTGDRPDVNPGDVTECPFSEVEGTELNLFSYDCNPVFTSTNETWGGDIGSVGFYATDVMGHPFYQMWYTSSSSDQFGSFGMGYAISSDGTNWDTHPNNPLFQADPTAWDKDSVSQQVILWDPLEKEYVMAYQGFTLGTGEFDWDTLETDSGTWGLGIATSPDGVNWSKSTQNPVINFSEDFDIMSGATISPCWPLTITLNRRGFRGYIAASRSEDAFLGEAACHIYAMNGIDADTWMIDDTAPVFEAGSEYDRMGFTSSSVVELEGIQYMFYTSFTDWTVFDGYQSATNITVNLATSLDEGESWVRDPNNPLPISTTNLASSVAAQVIGNRIHIWLTDVYDGQNAIGYFLFEPENIDGSDSENVAE